MRMQVYVTRETLIFILMPISIANNIVLFLCLIELPTLINNGSLCYNLCCNFLQSSSLKPISFALLIIVLHYTTLDTSRPHDDQIKRVLVQGYRGLNKDIIENGSRTRGQALALAFLVDSKWLV